MRIMVYSLNMGNAGFISSSVLRELFFFCVVGVTWAFRLRRFSCRILGSARSGAWLLSELGFWA